MKKQIVKILFKINSDNLCDIHVYFGIVIGYVG